MPNWASVVYVCKADEQQLKDLYDKLETMNHSEKSILENGFGKMWLGNLVHLLGGQWEEIECRGEINDYHLSGNKLYISFEHAWGDSENLRDFIKKCYPGMEISFSVEEEGMEIFVTNDLDEFPDKYHIDIQDDENDIYLNEYYRNLEDAVADIKSNFNVDLEPTYNAINDWLENKVEESDDFWYIFEEVEVITE